MARILIIDDDRPTREMLSEFLEPEGYEVVQAENGKAGIEVYHRQPADLIITDIFMPEKNGLRTIRELQRDFSDLKIIAISGGGEMGNLNPLILAEEIGIHHTFTKPFHLPELLSAVRELLGEDRQG